MNKPYVTQNDDGTFSIHGLVADQKGEKPSPMTVRTSGGRGRNHIVPNGSAFYQLGDKITVDGKEAYEFRGMNVSFNLSLPQTFKPQQVFLNPRSTANAEDDQVPESHQADDEDASDDSLPA